MHTCHMNIEYTVTFTLFLHVMCIIGYVKHILKLLSYALYGQQKHLFDIHLFDINILILPMFFFKCMYRILMAF